VEGMMNLCIPYLTIEPIISKLSAQYWYSSVRRGTTPENLNILRERLATVAINVIAEIGNMDIRVRDVLALRQGDIIRLDSVRVSDPMLLKVGDRRKFTCRPGVLGNKMAVQVIRKLEDIDQADFEELAMGVEED
jgi:flagellar motor switch protein FliM